MALTGECFCGEISYRINGSVHSARSCHCSRCRKAFSSQASAYALVDAEQFEWLTGQHLLTRYVGEHGFGIQFCSRCGSTLCGVFNEIVHGITLGCLNDDPGVAIEQHIFVASRAGWEVMPDGVIRFDEMPPSSGS